MSENLTLMAIPGLASTNPESVVNGIITASMKGAKVFLTADALAKLKTYFDKLGINVKEAEANLESEDYILLAVDGARLRVEIHENGRVSIKNFKLDVFISALERYIEKRKGAKEETKLYELLISEDLKEKLMKLKEEK